MATVPNQVPEYYQNLLAFEPHTVVNDYIMSEAPIRVIIKGNQGGGCLSFDSNISYLNGLCKPIKEVESGDIVYAVDDSYRMIPVVVKEKIDSGLQHTVKVVTRNGKQISVTPCHPFLTVDGWKKIEELKPDDYIATPRKYNDPLISQKARKWLYVLVGYLIGDGGITSGIKFTNTNQEIINDFRKHLPKHLSLKQDKKDLITYRVSSGLSQKNPNTLTAFLRKIGLFGKNSHTKFIPDFVMQSQQTDIALFLSRLFACDGWVDNRGIGYSSVSRKLIDDIQTLLLRFGIVARVRIKKSINNAPGSKIDYERTDYEISVRRLNDLKIFAKKIGIFSKQIKLEALIKKRAFETSKENYDTIPFSINRLKQKLETEIGRSQTGKVYIDRNKYNLIRTSRGKTITRDKLLEITKVIPDKKFKELAASDIFWDKIKSITPNGKVQTYDLEIEGTHNFVANNIFVHNTATASYDAVLRVLGEHPVAKRNVLNKPIRFISKVLPQSPEDEENQQYVEFKRLFPKHMILKDVTARSSRMDVRRPTGEKIKVEFMSSKQDLDAFMSVQRSALYQDEEIDKTKWDENQMRLLREGGDSTVSLTPAKGLDWTYDLLWCRASKIYRSPTICKKFGYPAIEMQDNGSGIEVFQWATDDNPVMTPDTIERIFAEVVDPEDLAMRRYGVFRQASGKIFKSFTKTVHVVPESKVFDPETFRGYWHFRVIDFHPSKPWYVSWVAITPTHEWFIWHELIASHDNCTSFDLRDKIKSESLLDEDDPFNRCTLIDPLSEVKQANTGYSVFDDLRLGEYGIRRLTPADTKNESARDRVKLRLANALRCEVPGNNINKDKPYDQRYGIYMPTIWILSNCEGHISHMDKWRMVDFKQEATKATRTVKRVSEKFSDFCRNIEFLAALDPVWYPMPEEEAKATQLFRGQRRYH